jgi:LysR family transcriptional regulator, benzoate and cis,cis-muconate-responsive activator of ben and cat genes
MELRQLRYFIAVAEELSFSKGARRSGVSQPPLSRQIANLEAELGTRLLDRSKHGVRLTDTGKVCYAEALKTLAAVDRTIDATQRAARGQSGSLALGFGGSAAYTFAPSLLRRFRELYPAVELSLHNLPMTSQLDALREQTIDLGFLMRPLLDNAFHSELVLRDPLVVAVPSGHALTKMPKLGLKALEPYPLVTFPRSSGLGFYSHVMAICKKADFVPTIAQEVAPMESVIGLVAAGVGIAVVPSVARRLRITGVEYRPFRERYAVMEFAIAWRKDNLSPVVGAFIELVRKQSRRRGRNNESLA